MLGGPGLDARRTGAEYREHLDTIPAFNELVPGGRFSTLILYLDDACEGGCTVFPELDLEVRPERGTALYFRNVRGPLLAADAHAMEPHPLTVHAGAPVLAGEKHIATKWAHPVPFPDG